MPELAAHLERVAKELAEQIEVRGENRCAICFWPLAKSVDEGCVRGNCSFRGGDEHEQKARWVIRERIKANAELLAAALAACAREAKLEQAEESEQALLAARKFVRGRHSVLTFGPRVLLEQLDLALLRITKLRLEVSGERAVGERA